MQKIPIYTIEQIEGCEHEETSEMYIRRLEVHLENLEFVHFPHRHDFYCLLYITQGSGTHEIDFNNYIVKPNQLFFMSQGQVHAWNLSKDVKGYILFFKKDFYAVEEKDLAINKLPFFYNLNNEPVMEFEPEIADEVSLYFEKILKEHQANQTFTDDSIRSFMRLIFIQSARFYNSNYLQDATPAHSSKIILFQELIEQHFIEWKSVAQYADQMNITANYLNALCNNILGKTAGQMIRERIILEAKRLILHSALTIAEIAYKLGYEDSSYFIRVFKKETNQTPEQLRLANK